MLMGVFLGFAALAVVSSLVGDRGTNVLMTKDVGLRVIGGNGDDIFLAQEWIVPNKPTSITDFDAGADVTTINLTAPRQCRQR